MIDGIFAKADRERCWSVSPDAITQCEREFAHGGRHQSGGLYWESNRSTSATDASGVLQEEPTGPSVEAHPEPRKEART